MLPINPFGGTPQQFAAQALSLAQHPQGSAADYENWLRRIDEYVRWTQQATVNMREGIRRGYTSPRVLIERMLPILERLGADDSANVFYAPLRSIPEAIKEPGRSLLTKAISSAISERLLPANRTLHDFLRQEYLPRARTGIALSELPLGSQWYAYRVKRATGAALSPDEIGRIGAAEVERIGIGALQQPHAAPLGDAELVSAYQDLEAQVRTAMPSLFSEAPKEDFDIRGAEWLPEPVSALYYQRAGVYGTGARGPVREYRQDGVAQSIDSRLSAAGLAGPSFSDRASAGASRLAAIPSLWLRGGLHRRLGIVCCLAWRGVGPVRG